VYAQKINKKMAKKALYTVLSAKARDNELLVVDDLNFPEVKTKFAAAMFGKFSQKFEKIRKGNGALVALAGKDDAARRAIRNLPYAAVEEARNLNAYEVLRYKYILFPKQAIEAMAKS